ncbi:head decoration protein [Piscinibacter defluvii]|uniref:head decoration protein n=1 Tax=Piscinibacter defluvii TaxID=1796922 RepID=UPI000FDD7E6C|nr:head decoration protein [Piscinibacter defluvii]
MVAKTANLGAGSAIKSEANGDLSREIVTIVSGSGKLPANMVLGKITATGKYKPYDDNNTDGSETAAAILVYDVDATSADVQALVIFRLAEVFQNRLQWASTVAAGEKTTAYADLAAAGKLIVMRT